MMTFRQELLRKLIHVSSLWMTAVIYYLTKQEALLFFGTLCIATASVDFMRKRNKTIKKVFICLFGGMLRKEELNNTTVGAVYFVLAAFLATLLFPKHIAIPAFCVMVISDTAAALIGKKFGKTKILENKTLEGTQAFFVTALLTLIVFKPLFAHNSTFYFAAIIAAGAATAVELYSKRFKVDDNLSIPISVGLVLYILT